MFEFGFGEMLLTAVVGLLVLGPKRLPKLARTLGLWARRARASWYSVRAELERELLDDDLRADLKSAGEEARRLREEITTLPHKSESAPASSDANTLRHD